MRNWSPPYLSALAVLFCVLSLALNGLGAEGVALSAEARNPDGVAVIVGNRNYTHPDVPDVNFAHRDADAFRSYVVDVLGFHPENILDLRDASQAEMEAAFGNERSHEGILWRYVNPDGGSSVVVFYSGHGVPGLKDGRGYLLPTNADPNAAEINGYPIDLLNGNLAKLHEAESVWVFLDACFSGSSHRGMLVRAASPASVTPSLPAGVAERITLLAAASGDQVASWDEEAGHGLFTRHLLDALYGQGDVDDDGLVTAREAKVYLDRHMTRAARRIYGRHQRADLRESGDVVYSAAIDGSFPARPNLDAPDPVSVAAEPKSDDGGGTEDDEIQAAPSPPSQDLAAVTGGKAIMTVETTPPGAVVFVGATAVGQTPVERYDLRAGAYTVTLDHPTHETVVLEDQNLADHRVLRIERTLVPATGSVTVITKPSGSWVEHEGTRLAESTPVTLEELPSGLLTLTLGAKGYLPARVEVLVPKGDVVLVEQVLEEVRYGTLTLELQPADAQAVLADHDAPYEAGMRLAEADHRIRVTREGYTEVSRTVTVLGETRERIVLEPAPQPFTVVTMPADASVRFLDRSEAYRPGIALPPGTHRVQVSAEGWETHVASVHHGTTPTQHALTLKRATDPAAEAAPTPVCTDGADTPCWMETANQPGCYVWNSVPKPDETVTWSGSCVDGKPSGKGKEVWRYRQDGVDGVWMTTDAEGELREGKAIGHWVLRFSDGEAWEGPYVDGKMHGRWVVKQGTRGEDWVCFNRNEPVEPDHPLCISGARKRQAMQPGRVFRDCPECPEMVVVPAGSFMMGSPRTEQGRSRTGREDPQHRVIISEPFAVGKYEVTFAEWDACVAAGSCGNTDDFGDGRGRRPVRVTWKSTRAYLAWLSQMTGEHYRLLSEAEWEYAARAGTKGPFHFGSKISTDQANYNGNYRGYQEYYGLGSSGVNRGMAIPVGSFPSNDFGLHDVHGNLREWVEDCWHDSYAGAPTNGTAWVSGGNCDIRVVRGGSFRDVPAELRSADRSQGSTTVGGMSDPQFKWFGFRIARPLTP